MRILYDKRGTGKTSKLITTSAVTGMRIITPNRDQAKMVKNMSAKMKLSIPEPMCCLDFLGCKGLPNECILLDNAEMILRSLFAGHTIKALTINDEAGSKCTDDRAGEVECLLVPITADTIKLGRF